ncbi:autotransporter assembly complex protein TamA [Suttonella sp. R2A3]|uniref:autotransporter assembly complex protein TamA n=1 Tax=Suttonella sp. R2A3 TaxID=2908648 RepID=UPI001F41C89D|nr:autotransporter assembly complex family protein [Suttonella sp. R2A3]UJF24514.1 autotransporter assembly complex protein TamA [Suttonella sp. R2A3]
MNKIVFGISLLGMVVATQAEPLFNAVGSNTNTASPASQPVGENAQAITGLKLIEIDIQGIENEEQRKNAYLFLTLNQVVNENINRPDYVNFLIEDGAKEIAESQQPFGYYNVRVDSKREQSSEGLIVHYTVSLGEPTQLTNVDVRLSGEAQNDPPFVELLNDNPLAVGQQLDHKAYEEYKARFKALASARGYFDGQFVEKRIGINPQNNSAEITLHFDSGERYKFTNVTYNQTELTPNLLQRFVPFSPGQPYTSKDVATLQQDLQGSGYFSQVLVGGDPDPVSKTVPVDAQLEMNKNKRYLIGLGYSTDQGPRAKFEFNWRWVNERGHTFDAKTFISEKDMSLDALYRIPSDNPTTDYYYLRGGGHYKDNDDYRSKRAFAEGGYNFRRDKWEHRYGLVTAWEDFRIGLDQADTLLLYPQARWTYTSTEDRLNPDSGYQVSLGLKGATDQLVSDVSFVQADLRARGLYSFNEQHRVIGRFDLGGLETNDFHRLPVSLRYFAGGDRSVRGYAFENIGPRDGSNTNIGGRYLAVGSVEYEYYFKPDWALAAFVDAGDATDKDFDFKVGAGVGLHWRSPVGPIDIDVAHGFDKNVGDNVRLHLTIGTELNL